MGAELTETCPVVWGSHGCVLPAGHEPEPGRWGTHRCCPDSSVPGGSGYGLDGREYYEMRRDGPGPNDDYVVKIDPETRDEPYATITPWGWEVRTV